MRINLYEPWLKFTAGHFLEYARNFSRALKRYDPTITVYGGRGINDAVVESLRSLDVHCEGIFSYDPRQMSGENASSPSFMEEACRSIARDIAASREAELFVFPTLTPEILGAYVQLTSPPRMSGTTQFHPSSNHVLGGKVWAESCRTIKERSLKANIFAIDARIGAVVQSFSADFPIRSIAVPHDGKPRGAKSGQLRRIGFFGVQRPERGNAMIAPLVNQLLSRGFEIVLQNSNLLPRDATVPPIRNLIRLDYVEDIAAEIAQCDMVINALHPAAYAQKTSGIVFDCIASAVPVITPAGTLPALIVQDYARTSRTLYTEFSVAGILRTLDYLSANYSGIAACFATAARDWALHHGVRKHIESLLEA